MMMASTNPEIMVPSMDVRGFMGFKLLLEVSGGQVDWERVRKR
jgi:hypothetical protein